MIGVYHKVFCGIKLVVGMAYPLATARSAEDLYTCWSKCFLEDSSKGITKHTAYYYSFKGLGHPLSSSCSEPLMAFLPRKGLHRGGREPEA